MKKEERIKRYGKEAYEKKRQQRRVWHRTHSEKSNEKAQLWKLNHPEKVEESNHELNRKGGKRYEKKLKYNSTGLQGKRGGIRRTHGRHYRPYKQIIAPNSQIHHEWIPETADFRGVALVEANQHLYGFIDVIQILEGEITLLTEEAIRLGVTNQ